MNTFTTIILHYIFTSNYFVHRTNGEYYRMLQKGSITSQKLITFYKLIFKQPMHIQVLAQGNITPEEAMSFFDTTASTLKADQHTAIEIPENLTMKVPDGGTKILRVDTFNSKDSNSIIRNYYQFGPGNIRQEVYLDICQQLMSEPLFDILRTKEQLGYHVASECLNTDGILGMRVYVNSQVIFVTSPKWVHQSKLYIVLQIFKKYI